MAAADDHRHCRVCGKVTGVKDEFCSRACREKREATIQSRRTYTYVLYGLMAFLIFLLLLGYVHL